MRVLGIETSCDETGVAIYDSQAGLMAEALYTQKLPAEYGGVVPELASRDHIRKTLPMIHAVLDKAGVSTVDGIAYSAGPGLAGGLMVGAMLAHSLSFAWQIPCLGVHHMEGHLLAPMLEEKAPEFPFVALLVSGGHTLLVDVRGVGQYKVLGESIDDAVGEAFDKTARLLGLPYPGGAHIEKLAEKGEPNRFDFPRPMIGRPGLDFSFSGLKTFAANTIRGADNNAQTHADIARGFQDAVVDTMAIKCRRALRETKLGRLVVAGGVGANQALRKRLKYMCDKEQATLFFPRMEYCTDNGAMIAYAGWLRMKAGYFDEGGVQIRPRWSLESLLPLLS